jgi:VRR-NUC domain
MPRADESALLSRLLVRCSQLGARIFRNNVGRLKDRNGRWVQYGLCVGSSDLIGYLPVTITPEHVGQTLAVFVAIEAKSATGTLRPEQRQFLNVVHGHGGITCLARSEADAEMTFAPWL